MYSQFCVVHVQLFIISLVICHILLLAKRPVQLLNIMRSQLTVALQSEVTNGNICLVIGDNRGDVIGRVPIATVLTTNKWQMISFTADIKTRENLQIYVKVRIVL